VWARDAEAPFPDREELLADSPGHKMHAMGTSLRPANPNPIGDSHKVSRQLDSVYGSRSS